MIIFVHPVLVACSSLAHYVFNLFEVYPNNRLDQWLMWTIMAAICGTIAGIGLIIGAVITKKVELLGVGSPGPGNRPRQISFCTATQPR
jgi:short subunit fatty acids transporter